MIDVYNLKALTLDDIIELWFCALVLLVLSLLLELLILSSTAVSKAALGFIIHSATTFQFQFVYTN